MKIRSRVQKFPAWHTKAAPYGKRCEEYTPCPKNIVPFFYLFIFFKKVPSFSDTLYSAIYGEVNVSVEKCVEVKGDYVEK